METKKLDEIIDNLESLKRLNAITESGEETLIELKAIKQALSQHDVIKSVCNHDFGAFNQFTRCRKCGIV